MCEECHPLSMRAPSGCMCGCSFRRFLSGGEEIEKLEQYKAHLLREIQGVEARIEELREVRNCYK